MRNRILVIRATRSFGGSEKVLLDLLTGIDFERSAVWLASFRDVFSKKLTRLRLPVQWIPLSVPLEGGFWKVLAAWLRFLWRVRPSKIVMAYGCFTEYPLAAVVAAYGMTRGNVNLIFHGSAPLPPEKKNSKLHFGFLPGFGLWWYRAVLPVRAANYLARHVLAVSRAVREMLVRGYGCPSRKISAEYHGVDCFRFSPASERERSELRRAYHLPDDAVVVASTARLVPLKRVDRLVRVFNQLATGDGTLWLLLAGDGPMQEQIAGLANSGRAGPRIRLLGHVEDVAPLLRASDIYVLPSESEGLPLALLEAMAVGLVCVVTQLPGLDETITDGENGFFAEPTDEGLTGGLQRALQLDKARKAVLVNHGCRTVLSRFEVSAAVRRELACLDIPSASDQVILDQACRAPI